MAFAKDLRGAQQLRCTVASGVDAQGNPVPLENIHGLTEDAALVTPLIDENDPKTIIFRRTTGSPNDVTCKVEVVADGRAGEGEILLREPGILNLLAGDAVSMTVTVGEPEPIPEDGGGGLPDPGRPDITLPGDLPGSPPHVDADFPKVQPRPGSPAAQPKKK